MTTAQDVLRSVLIKAGLDNLSPNISSGDQQIAEIVDLINETGQDLTLRGEWQAMQSSIAMGALPADFSKVAFVVTADGIQARRVTDPGHWAFLTQQVTQQPYYRIAAGEVQIAPDQVAGMTYWSSHWTDAGEAVTADSDLIYLPMVPMVTGTFYRWLRKKGLPFDDQMAQHEADVAAAQKADRGL